MNRVYLSLIGPRELRRIPADHSTVRFSVRPFITLSTVHCVVDSWQTLATNMGHQNPLQCTVCTPIAYRRSS